MLCDVLSPLSYCQTRALCYTTAGPTEAACRLVDFLLPSEDSALVRRFLTKREKELSTDERDRFVKVLCEVAKYIDGLQAVIIQITCGGLTKTIDLQPTNENVSGTPTQQELAELLDVCKTCVVVTIDTDESQMVHVRYFTPNTPGSFQLKQSVRTSLQDDDIVLFEKVVGVDSIPESTIRRIIREEIAAASFTRPLEKAQREDLHTTTNFERIRALVSQS